jgi:uncharacterized protein YndB with AHSA1/START domain
MSGTSAPTRAPGAIDGPGLLEGDRATASITFRRLVRHPIHEVWEAITDPKQLAIWSMATIRRDDENRATLEMDYPNGIRATGRVLEWAPPRAYEYEWNLAPGPHRPSGEASVVRWELSPVEGGTLLVMTHRKLSRGMASVFVRGLPVMLDRLAAQLDGVPLPDPPWVTAGPTPRSGE